MLHAHLLALSPGSLLPYKDCDTVVSGDATAPASTSVAARSGVSRNEGPLASVLAGPPGLLLGVQRVEL
ncbi:hypothetical protein NL676_019205 [Syzygium grande]|nr:hypothetical protein NL676_019205 [Syzygium grande]